MGASGIGQRARPRPEDATLGGPKPRSSEELGPDELLRPNLEKTDLLPYWNRINGASCSGGTKY